MYTTMPGHHKHLQHKQGRPCGSKTLREILFYRQTAPANGTHTETIQEETGTRNSVSSEAWVGIARIGLFSV